MRKFIVYLLVKHPQDKPVSWAVRKVLNGRPLGTEWGEEGVGIKMEAGSEGTVSALYLKPGDSGTWGWKGGQQSMGKLCCLLIRPHKLNSARLVQYADGERADSCFLLMAS